MTERHLLTRVESLIEKGERVAGTVRRLPDNFIGFDDPVDTSLFSEWKTQSLAFLTGMFGDRHIYTESFRSDCVRSGVSDASVGLGILRAVQGDIQDGYLLTLRELVHAEVFEDYLSMAEHLVNNGGYKDAAAVIAGSTLEEHLRKLCSKHGITITTQRPNGSTEPKKASVLNQDLRTSGIYNQLEWRQVDAWLDIRNKSAHGEYVEYSQSQVEHMIVGIREFMLRNIA